MNHLTINQNEAQKMGDWGGEIISHFDQGFNLQSNLILTSM